MLCFTASRTCDELPLNSEQVGISKAVETKVRQQV
jgi:hypothetical protein